MTSLPLARRVLKIFHPEGIPGIATYIYNAVSKTRIFQRNYDLVARDILNHCASGKILDIGTLCCLTMQKGVKDPKMSGATTLQSECR